MAGCWLLAIAACGEPSHDSKPKAQLEDVDVDGDGYDAPDDCDDGNPDVHPGAAELCNGHDDDCDGNTDVGAVDATMHWPDADSDGYGAGTGVSSCETPAGMADNDDDCNDARIDAHPGGVEVCDATDVDQDCDGLTDDEDDSVAPDTTTWMYADADGDGFGDSDTSRRACDLIEGWSLDSSDCDDARDTVYPDAKEVCNDGVDNDCDATSNPCRWAGTNAIADATAVITGEHDRDCFGADVASAGDLDGDGDEDLLIGGFSAYVMLGPVSTVDASAAHARVDSDAEGDGIGFGMVGLGDQDGDGYDDVILSAASYDAAAGRVYAVMGPLSGASTVGAIDAATITGEGEDSFGWDVSAGDVNGDGVLDLLASASGQNSLAGGAYLYDGPLTVGDLTLADASASFVGTDAGDVLGGTVAANGDVDGDGIDDVVLTAPYDADGGGIYNGSAWLFYGPTVGAHTEADVDVWIHGAGSDAQLGYASSSGGDLDGDGQDDLVLSATGAGGMSEGQVFVFLATSVLAATELDVGAADATITGDEGDQIAPALDSAGDFDADGCDDLIAGSVFVGDWNQGAVWGFYGPVTGTLDVGADESFSFVVGGSGIDSNEAIGGVVALVRDVSGDGVDDLALARPYAAGTDGTYQGALHVFEGIGY